MLSNLMNKNVLSDKVKLGNLLTDPSVRVNEFTVYILI